MRGGCSSQVCTDKWAMGRVAQKVAGLTKGIHKDEHLIVVKYDFTQADGLSALEKITGSRGPA